MGYCAAPPVPAAPRPSFTLQRALCLQATPVEHAHAGPPHALRHTPSVTARVVEAAPALSRAAHKAWVAVGDGSGSAAHARGASAV